MQSFGKGLGVEFSIFYELYVWANFRLVLLIKEKRVVHAPTSTIKGHQHANSPLFLLFMKSQCTVHVKREILQIFVRSLSHSVIRYQRSAATTTTTSTTPSTRIVLPFVSRVCLLSVCCVTLFVCDLCLCLSFLCVSVSVCACSLRWTNIQ